MTIGPRPKDRSSGLHERGDLVDASATELAAQAVILRREAAGGTIRAWRKAAIADLLDRFDAEPEVGVRRTWLAEARALYAEGVRLEDRASATQRGQHLIYVGVLVCLVALAIAGATAVWNRFDRGIDQWWVLAAAALTGSIGGTTSVLQRGRTMTALRIPERVVAYNGGLIRPFLGAVAGGTVWLAFKAGIAKPADHAVAYLLLGAFGAGFAERLVLRNESGEPLDAARPAAGDGAPTDPNAAPASAPTPAGATASPTDPATPATPAAAPATPPASPAAAPSAGPSAAPSPS